MRSRKTRFHLRRDCANKVNAMKKYNGKSAPQKSPMALKSPATFNAQAFLDSAGAARQVAELQRKEIIFSLGDVPTNVM
jgi:hypothetical protein